MIQELPERGFQLKHMHIYKIVQEDPHHTFVPAGSNEEVKNRTGTKISVDSE